MTIQAWARQGSDDYSVDVEIDYELAAVEIVVRDRGHGLQAGSSDQLGVGLPMIAALSDDFAISANAGGGVEVWMRFICSDAVDGPPLDTCQRTVTSRPRPG